MTKKIFLTAAAAGAAFACVAENVTPICMMDLTNVTTGWREPGVNQTVEGNPLRVGRRTWERGLGVHAPSKGVFDLEGKALRFEATVGVDDESFGTVTFRVLGDGRLLWDSGRLSAGDKVRTKDVKVDLTDVQELTLEVTDFDGNRDGDHADWLDARIVFRDGAFGSNDPRQTRQLGIQTPAVQAPRAPRKADGKVPAMGWSGGCCGKDGFSAEAVKRAAEALVTSGLAKHGWNTVVADLPGSELPDLKELAEAVHRKGLRFGVGYAGVEGNEERDAAALAKMGCDFVRYGLKSTSGSGLADQMRPFLLMGRALAAQERKIVFAISQGGAGRVPTWGRCANAGSWRVGGTVFEDWRQITAAMNRQNPCWHFSAPGQFNDAGPLHLGARPANDMKGCALWPNEQYTQVSLWALAASPLFLDCDVAKLDAFALGLLTNDEVIDISQDPLGAAAARVAEAGRTEIWMRPLADGSIAAGLCNREAKEGRVVVDFAALGLEGAWKVRDCWRQADEGVVTGRYAPSVPGHATHLVRLVPQPGAGLRKGLCDVRDNQWLRQMK